MLSAENYNAKKNQTIRLKYLNKGVYMLEQGMLLWSISVYLM